MKAGTSCKQVPSSDRGNPVTKSKDNLVTPENQKRRDEYTTATHVKKRDDNVTAPTQKKRSERRKVPTQKKRDDHVTKAHLKYRVDRETAPSKSQRDDCLEKRQTDNYSNVESPEEEEVSGRRKHHILWTTAEVKNLIDGVSEYGVGRWSRIKKLFFSSSAHRTSVDLKVKIRF